MGILMACMASSFFAFLLASLLVLWTVELQMILRESILCWAGDSHFRVLIHHAHYLALWDWVHFHGIEHASFYG